MRSLLPIWHRIPHLAAKRVGGRNWYPEQAELSKNKDS